MPPKKKRKFSAAPFNIPVTPGKCIFCSQSEDNEEKYGKMMTKDGLSVHYFCMLFSSALKQLGKTDEDGFLGFLAKDIKLEVRRGKRLKCSFCKTVGATIGCVNSTCRQKYHYRCGLDNDVLFQFFGSFSSFCAEHRPHQAAPTRERLSFKGCAKSSCAICLNAVTTRASNHTLRSPCCKNAWFHRACIQSMANSSGLHFFKCPLCNNKELFQEEMLIFGICIPDQDAAWEREPNAFEDLMHIINTCHVETCICPFGRDVNRLDTEWEVMRCDLCGSKGTHLKCSNLSSALSDWACLDCSPCVGEVPIVDKKNTSPIPKDYLEAKFKKTSNSLKKNGKSVKSLTPSKKNKSQKVFVSCKKGKRKTNKCKLDVSTEEVLYSLQNSPLQDSDSEVRFTIAQDSLESLKPLKTKERVSNSIKKKYKKRKRATQSFESLEIKDVKKCLKKLKKSQSLVVVNQKKDPQVNLMRSRSTKRSQMAEKALLELCTSDIAKRPYWVKDLYKADIMTGKNLGNTFAKESPMLSSGILKIKTKSSINIAMKTASKNVIGGKQEEVCLKVDHEDSLHSADRVKEDHRSKTKQLLLTNFLSGGNSATRVSSEPQEVKKTDKVRVVKKRKRSSEDSLKIGNLDHFLHKKDDQSLLSSPDDSVTSSLPVPPQDTSRKEDHWSASQENIWGTPEVKKERKKGMRSGAKAQESAQTISAESVLPLKELCGNKNRSRVLAPSLKNQNVSAKCLSDTTLSDTNISKENGTVETTEVGRISGSSVTSVKTGKNSNRASSCKVRKKRGRKKKELDLNANVNPAKKPRYTKNQRAVYDQSRIKNIETTKRLLKECNDRMECGMTSDKFDTPESTSCGRCMEASVNLSESTSSGGSPGKGKLYQSSSTIVLDSDTEEEDSPIPILSPQDNRVALDLFSDIEMKSLPALSPQNNSNKVPLIDLYHEIDSETTLSCDEESLPTFTPKFLSFKDFVRARSDQNNKKALFCDLTSDTTDQEVDTSTIVINDSISLDSDTEHIVSDKNTSLVDLSTSPTSCTKQHSQDVPSDNDNQALGKMCTNDYSDFILQPARSDQEWVTLMTQVNPSEKNVKKAIMPHSSCNVGTSSSFVDLGKYQDSKMCVIS